MTKVEWSKVSRTERLTLGRLGQISKCLEKDDDDVE